MILAAIALAAIQSPWEYAESGLQAIVPDYLELHAFQYSDDTDGRPALYQSREGQSYGVTLGYHLGASVSTVGEKEAWRALREANMQRALLIEATKEQSAALNDLGDTLVAREGANLSNAGTADADWLVSVLDACTRFGLPPFLVVALAGFLAWLRWGRYRQHKAAEKEPA